MKEIQLTQGKVAIVSNDWYEYLNKWSWCYQKPGKGRKTGYAVRDVYTPYRKTILMHRVIMNTPDGMEVDHVDGDGLNNLTENLRNCTHSQNTINQPERGDNTTGFKGVHWHKRDNIWQAKITINGKQIHLGYHNTSENAARAYDAAAKKYFGKFAYLNFP